MSGLSDYIKNRFGVDEDIFLEAINISPSARGYIMGAISELFLAEYLKKKGFEVLRIKEKPKGGNNAKSSEARGDFYIRPINSEEDKWLVIESKGLKSNSEFRGDKLNSPDKLFRFLKAVVSLAKNKSKTYENGLRSYKRIKALWEAKNKRKSFPQFNWNKEFPGPIACDLSKIWKSEDDLKKWVYALPKELFTETAYRKVAGAIAILETHQPSTRVAPITGLKQAAPLVSDFNIMAVDLFLRTGKHEFVFMNSSEISHSPTSPEHLYQNYVIDILVKGRKEELRINRPWYTDIEACIKTTKPQYRIIDKSQLDNREVEEM
ncbi:MAG: hypothetical protein L6Q29_01220 [Candidatus Pacebacteria bacterium]|nr:hypothetical protein [Candidatus Paceibacterota bacterium]NUQ57099.1 hypothetical protein [Candidatus Paceibacter sp.]